MAEDSSGKKRQKSEENEEETENSQERSIPRSSIEEEQQPSTSSILKNPIERREYASEGSQDIRSNYGRSSKDEEKGDTEDGTGDGDEEDEDGEEEDLPFPGFAARSFYIFRQTTKLRYWALHLITWPYPF